MAHVISTDDRRRRLRRGDDFGRGGGNRSFARRGPDRRRRLSAVCNETADQGLGSRDGVVQSPRVQRMSAPLLEHRDYGESRERRVSGVSREAPPE